MTGDGFLEMGSAFAIGTIEDTIADAISIVVGKHTILGVHNTGNQFARGVGIDHSLPTDDLTCFWSQFIPHHFHRFFYLCYFFLLHWCSCITFDTATAFAHREVATEMLREKVERNEGVLDFKHNIKR
jgi:hypothetical protein